jgi:hypothetical protein
MKKRMFRLAVMVYAVSLMANVAQAGILPGGFNFSFFNSAILGALLLPLQLVGCAG